MIKNNLIGISGKMGSGKDLLYNMLCELSDVDFENKKFAYPIKWIVSVLIGCDIRQLEDREFKEKELGEEWFCWEITEHWINDDSNVEVTSTLFASEEDSNNYWEECHLHDEIADSPKKIKLTPRKLMQLLGTEAGREIIHPNIWVNALFADYKGKYLGATDDMKEPVEMCFPNWIITDVRFPNEAKAIKDRGGIVIRVERKPFNRAGGMEGNKQFSKQIEEDTHPSETALDGYEFDAVIDNNGSIEDLIEKVKQLKLV